MKLCRRVEDPILGTMLGVVLVDQIGTVWTIGGEARPDVMGAAVRRRLEFTWMDVSSAVVPS